MRSSDIPLDLIFFFIYKDYLISDIYSAHISAHLSPSTPAETIPPAYPAPSPQDALPGTA